jgi:hypothetical protein
MGRMSGGEMVKNHQYKGNVGDKDYQYKGNVCEKNYQYKGNPPNPPENPVSRGAPRRISDEPCVVCGKPAKSRTCYIYYEDGSERIGAPWCEEHVRQLERFANPIFESPKALERFRAERPRLYERDVEGREIIFLRREKSAT